MAKRMLDRFWKKVDTSSGENGCWIWIGARNKQSGYGWFKTGPKREAYAHRVSYEIHHGTLLPRGHAQHIDHLCRNRACVNPAHLELVSASENTRRSDIHPSAVNRAKTHCKRGHAYTHENTKQVGTHRLCRACRQMHHERWSLTRQFRRAVEEKEAAWLMRLAIALLFGLLVTANLAHAQERKSDGLFTVAMVAYSLGTAADVVSTHAAIASGNGQEGNPIMAQGSAVRIAAGAGLGYLLVRMHKTHPKAATVLGFAASSFYLTIAAHNAAIARGAK